MDGQPDQIADRVIVDGDRVTVSLSLTDPVLTGLLLRHDEDRHVEVARRALAAGARGLLTMGVGLDLGEVDQRVRHAVERATEEAHTQVRVTLDEARQAMTTTLDPEQRTSLMGKVFADFEKWRAEFLRGLDPDLTGSHTERLLARLDDIVGPDGTFERRLSEALDPGSDGSGLGRLAELIDRRFVEMRELFAERRGRRDEASRGTAKGVDFEDAIEELLRTSVRTMGGVVERTSRSQGELGSDVVGDLVVSFGDDTRVVVEVKNARTLTLTGSDGILAELDRAMANRSADVAICVSADDAFPQEVGPFGVYDNRLLVVDDGEGTMLWVALRWALMTAQGRRAATPEFDARSAEQALARIRQVCRLFSTNRRSLGDIAGSIDKVRGSLETMRGDLLELVDDVSRALRTGNADTPVLDIRQAG